MDYAYLNKVRPLVGMNPVRDISAICRAHRNVIHATMPKNGRPFDMPAKC